MNSTIELLDFVRQGNPDRSLADHLHVSPTTISMARRVGRASPELAGKLACVMSMDLPVSERQANIQKWVAIAVAEQLPPKKGEWLLDQIGMPFVERKPRTVKSCF